MCSLNHVACLDKKSCVKFSSSVLFWTGSWINQWACLIPRNAQCSGVSAKSLWPMITHHTLVPEDSHIYVYLCNSCISYTLSLCTALLCACCWKYSCYVGFGSIGYWINPIELHDHEYALIHFNVKCTHRVALLHCITAGIHFNHL